MITYKTRYGAEVTVALPLPCLDITAAIVFRQSGGLRDTGVGIPFRLRLVPHRH